MADPKTDATQRSAIYILLQMQQALRIAVEDGLRPLGLTPSQMGVLSALSRQPHLSNAALARLTFVKPQSMVPLLQGLEAAGCIVRRTPAGGRVMPTDLTALGRQRLAAGRLAMAAIEERMTGDLPITDRQHLARLLECCLTALRAQ